jgi:hypothetical protein
MAGVWDEGGVTLREDVPRPAIEAGPAREAALRTLLA